MAELKLIKIEKVGGRSVYKVNKGRGWMLESE